MSVHSLQPPAKLVRPDGQVKAHLVNVKLLVIKLHSLLVYVCGNVYVVAASEAVHVRVDAAWPVLREGERVRVWGRKLTPWWYQHSKE